MEKTTVTIEIRQEVSVTLLWIVAGVVLVSGAFFLAPRSSELWTALNYAGVAAALYLIALLMYALRKPLALKHKLLMGIGAIVVISIAGFIWVRMERHVHWQAETMMRIRGVVGRGVMRNEMTTVSLNALEALYWDGSNSGKTLADVFREQHPGVAIGSNIHKQEWDRDSSQTIITRLDSQRIEMVSQEKYVPGTDPSFKNLNGQFGMVQEKLVLTPRGITHVSEN